MGIPGSIQAAELRRGNTALNVLSADVFGVDAYVFGRKISICEGQSADSFNEGCRDLSQPNVQELIGCRENVQPIILNHHFGFFVFFVN